jgi:hypothetical protein
VREGAEWQPPEVVVQSLAGEPSLDRAGNLDFTHHHWDNANRRLIEADLYRCLRAQ